MKFITYRKYAKILAYRFIFGTVLNTVIQQNTYKIVGKQVFLNVAIRGYLYRFFFRKIILHTFPIKTPIWFAQLILILISKTNNVTIVGKENLQKIEKEKQKVIFAFWHGSYTLLLTSLYTDNPVTLVRWSFRGNYVAQLFSVFNYRIIQTSSTRKSLRELVEAIKHGHLGFIAVDGPQGPAHQTKPGIIYTAREAGAKIIPLALKTHRGFILKKRWDNHCIPLPLSNITVLLGRAIDVKPGDSLKTKGEEVTRSLLKLTIGEKENTFSSENN